MRCALLSVVPEGGQAPELIRELARETKGVPQHLRISASPFLDETTRAAIAKSGRQHLIVGGFATEVLVLHAACDAIAAGYEVHVPVDACGGMSFPHGRRGVSTDRAEGRDHNLRRRTGHGADARFQQLIPVERPSACFSRSGWPRSLLYFAQKIAQPTMRRPLHCGISI